MKSLLIALTLALPSLLSAEGIPVDRDTGKITSPHTVVALNADQREELTTVGSVTLTSRQWADLRKVAPATPKRFDWIESIESKDCTCGGPFEFYCIGIDNSKIAVLHRDFIVEELAEALQTEDYLGSLYVDQRGQFYYNGCLIPFPLLLKAVGQPVTGHEGLRTDWPSVRIPQGMTRNSPAIKARLTQLEAAATKAGWQDVKPQWQEEE